VLSVDESYDRVSGFISRFDDNEDPTSAFKIWVKTYLLDFMSLPFA
jgi:hypothetical protein